MLFAPVAYSTGVWASLLLVVLAQCMATAATPPQQDLARASLQISDAISKILSRWDVNQFPIFLRTAWMFSDSHKQMKDRFKLKVAASLAGHSESFVASFTGSSVTAGHDHLFVQSYPVLVGILLQPAFAAAGINLTTRNAAMGNNPCMPYDVCVGTFADENSDIVIWEQSYNCHPSSKGYLYEQFVRQAMLLPSKPLIAFSDSETPNWYLLLTMNATMH